jgi:hypothetical protein
MENMGLPSFSIYENIIKENQDKIMEERMKDMIHESLKSGGSITKAEWHNQEIMVTLMSSKCSRWNVLFFHMNLVVARVDIKFGKIPSTT